MSTDAQPRPSRGLSKAAQVKLARDQADQATAQARADRLGVLPFQRTDARSRGFLRGIGRSFLEITGQNELLGLLVRRELKARYKDSSLGFVWTLIKPLTMLLIYFVAIGQVLGAARSVPDFAIFVYAGLTLWSLYSEILTSGTQSIVSNAGLIRKVYLPREIFPLAAVGSALINFGIQFGILLIAVIVSGEFPLSWHLLYIPAAALLTLVWGLAFALLYSALNVYLRDVQYLVEVGVQMLFWASPIVYSWSLIVGKTQSLGIGWLAEVYLLNPISLAMLAFQEGIWKAGSETRHLGNVIIQPQPYPSHLPLFMLIAFVVGLIFLAISQRIFTRLQGNFAQEI
jgi:ABC-2 type transport system permease protein